MLVKENLHWQQVPLEISPSGCGSGVTLQGHLTPTLQRGLQGEQHK